MPEATFGPVTLRPAPDMKITAIRVHILKSPLAQPFAFSQGWVRQRVATLVEVETDTGIVGWGEAFAQGLEPPEIAAAAIVNALTPLAVGADPLAPEVLWHRMYHATRDYGRTGSVVAAISAIDIAVWDIAGKAYGVPICQLLGGAFRTSVTAYATGFYRISGQGEATRLGAEAVAHAEAGFTAMKVKLGFGVDDDLKVMPASWPDDRYQPCLRIFRCAPARRSSRRRQSPMVRGAGGAGRSFQLSATA